MKKQLIPIAIMLLFSFGVMCRNQKPEDSWTRVIISGRDTVVMKDGNMDLEKCRSAHGWMETVTHTEYFEFMNAHIDTSLFIDLDSIYIQPIDTFTPKPLKIEMIGGGRRTSAPAATGIGRRIDFYIDTSNGSDVFVVDTALIPKPLENNVRPRWKDSLVTVTISDIVYSDTIGGAKYSIGDTGSDLIAVHATVRKSYGALTFTVDFTNGKKSVIERDMQTRKWSLSSHPDEAIELLYQYYIQIQKEFMECKNRLQSLKK